MMKCAHAISNNYLPQPRDGKKFENLFRSDMQEVAYFSAKITSFCNQTFYPDIAEKMVLHKQTHMHIVYNVHARKFAFKNTYLWTNIIFKNCLKNILL